MNMNMNNINRDSFTQVGEYVYELNLNKQEKEKIYKDSMGNFFLELANNSFIFYPSATRIQDFVSAWDKAYYIDTADGRHHYIVYPYEGITLDIWGNTIAELLELIRQFVTPSSQINRALESSIESHEYYEDTAMANFGKKK